MARPMHLTTNCPGAGTLGYCCWGGSELPSRKFEKLLLVKSAIGRALTEMLVSSPVPKALGMDDSLDMDVLRQQLRRDQQGTLAAAFSEHHQRLEWIVNLRLDRRLNSRVGADDVLQEAYMQALQRIGHFLADPSVSLFVWLRSITCQTLVDIHRRHLGAQSRDAGRDVSIYNRSYVGSNSISLAEVLSGSSTSPSGAAARDELARQMESALAKLDEIDREVIVMRHFEDLTNNDVAQVLGLQPSAASMRYSRALQRLKEVFEMGTTRSSGELTGQ